jgi:hypothetical protein
MSEKAAKGQESDYVLESIIRLVDSSEDELLLPMTFNLGGALVSGYLISESQYLKEVQDDEATSDGIIFALAQIKKEGPPHSNDAANEEKLRPIEHVHLRNARIYVGGQAPIPSGAEAALWRGRINSIDGYILGELQPKRR